ncbi:hypothetical protein JDV09_24945 [Mycobacterium sp. Y57]|nr:hypothetical protein [Mycolicibacterium xanthum]
MRMVAGVCAVVTGLLLGGGTAVAAADPDSDGTSSDSTSADSTSADSTSGAQDDARPAVGNFGALRETLTGSRGTNQLPTATSIAALARATLSSAARATSRAAADPDVDELESSSSGELELSNSGESESSSFGESSTLAAEATTSVPTPAAPSEPATKPLTPITDTIESLTSSISQVPALTAPVTNSIPVVSDLVAPVTQAIEQLPDTLAPTFQIMAATEGAMTAVIGRAVRLTQQPADLAALLGALTNQPATDSPHVTAYLAAPAESLWTPPQTSILGAPSKTSIIDVPSSPESAWALTPQLLSSGATLAAAPQSTAPAMTQPDNWLLNLPAQIANAVREKLRNVSLTELALAALPGIAGLVVFFATGIGLGHRQAKFGFVMQMTGIMRFAPSGPVGVVRSGSFIAVHPKKARATARHRPGTRSRRLDQSA